MTNYCFVLDADGKLLSPTKEQKAWYMIRKGKAKLVSKYPMVIQLNRIIPEDEICKDKVRCGIDDGSAHVGIALVQKCKTRNKVLFKGTIEHRKDVKHLIETRKGYRHIHRSNKRYRKTRFNNRSSSRRSGRLAPSILQKRQAVIRVIRRLLVWINIDSYWLEDISIDIRALTDGYKPYSWEYCKSNRLDDNLRKATIMRDGNRCMECGKKKCRLEVHHIRPRRMSGSDTINNLITLCECCHNKTKGFEEDYMQHFFDILNTSDVKNLNYSAGSMIGKNWLRGSLSELGDLHITSGGDTANKRNDWGISKTHSNDALCITNLKPDTVDITDWTIKPMRRRTKARTSNVFGIQHRDLVSYTYRNGDSYTGYVTALYPDLGVINFNSKHKHCKKVNAKKCDLLWRFSKIYWLIDTI